MITHKDCGGHFDRFVIREHGYCFMRCSRCLSYLGGERVKREVNRLMKIKVRPTIREV